MTIRRSHVIAAGSGLLLALAFPAFHLWPLAWVALAPLFAQTRKLGRGSAAGHWLLAGFGFHLVVLHWLMANVQWAGGWAFWGYAALCFYLALYWGAYGWLLVFLRGRRWAPPLWASAPVLWMAMEQAQQVLFTGFGWGALAYSQGPDMAFIQCASLGGCAFIAGALIFSNVALSYFPYRIGSSWVRLAGLAVLIAVTHALGYWLLELPEFEEDPLRAGMFQSNFAQGMKWDFEYYEEMTRHAVQKTQLLARTEEVDLVIWPESLVMEPITEARIGGMLESLTRNEAMWLYAGAVRHGSQLGESYNSSHLFRPDGSVVGHYDKIHLAPFGEYIPLAQYLPFVSNFVPAISDITPGEELVTFEAEHKRFGPLICFEVLFPRYAMAHRQAGADFLVVITNLAWFGASNAMAQELEMARIRAIESRLPVLHCANTGVSGLIDPWGRFAAVDRYAYGARLSEPMTPPPPLEEVQRKRMAGAFDVPEPGGRCWPWGVRYLGWTAFGISVIGVLAAAFSGRPRPAAA